MNILTKIINKIKEFLKRKPSINKAETPIPTPKTYSKEVKRALDWNKANPDRVKQHRLMWNKSHPEKMREIVNRYNANNREKVRDRKRELYHQNIEHEREMKRARYYRKKNGGEGK